MRFTDLLEDKNGFRLTEKQLSGVPDGVDANLLWNLWDIVCKQGENFFSFGKLVIAIRHGAIQLEAHDFRGNDAGGRAGLSVFYYEKGRRFQTTSAGTLVLTLENGMSVIWDRRVPVALARTFIETIDETCREYGELVDGVRTQSRKDFFFWKDWVFYGTRVVSVPNRSPVPHIWKIAYKLDLAEGNISSF